MLAGAGSVGCRTVNLMYTQGYRRFTVHGMDCSFADDGEQHAGKHYGKKQQDWVATCNGRQFHTSGTLIAIAKGFLDNMALLEIRSKEESEPIICEGDCIELRLHGNGLLSEMARSGGTEAGIGVDPGDNDTSLATAQADD